MTTPGFRDSDSHTRPAGRCLGCCAPGGGYCGGCGADLTDDTWNGETVSTKAAVWNHPDRLANDPEYRARWDAFQAQPNDVCSVPQCERTEPCESAENGWCGLPSNEAAALEGKH